MSAPEFALAVTATDLIAGLTIFDGQSHVVARGAGSLRASLPRGLYRVRIRVGSATAEQLVVLDQDRAIIFGPLPFATAIPLRTSEKTREAHMLAATAAATMPPQATFGDGASIMLLARDWSLDDHATTVDPAQGLALLDTDENLLADIGEQALTVRDGDACASWRADVAPGGYFLRLQFDDADKTTILRPIYVSPGQQLQVFCLSADQLIEEGGEQRAVRRADLANAAITISTTGQFDPDDLRMRATELACAALTQSHDALSPALLLELPAIVAHNPTFGLFAAHLLLMRWQKAAEVVTNASDKAKPPFEDAAVFRAVTDAMLATLGADHPDLRALWWKRDGESLGDGRLHALPMLRASWNLAVDRSIRTFDVLSLGTFATKLTRITPSVPWVTLLDNDWAISDIAIDDYIAARAQSKARVSRAEARAALASRSLIGRMFSRVVGFAANNLPAVLTHLPDFSAVIGGEKKAPPRSIEESVPLDDQPQAPNPPAPRSANSTAQPPLRDGATAAASAGPLRDDEKADLARTLAIPADVLEGILKRKGH